VSEELQVAIVGGGIGGLTAALAGLKNLKDEKATHIVNAAWAMRYGLALARYHSSDEE